MQIAAQAGVSAMMHGGDLLRTIRIRRGLSLEEAAHHVEVTGGTLRRWEKMEVWYRDEADPNAPFERPQFQSERPAPYIAEQYLAARGPIGGGCRTTSQDGEPVAPLMGQQDRFDGGGSFFAYQPFVFVFAYNDHAAMFQFLPTGTQSTDVVITWLVMSSAASS